MQVEELRLRQCGLCQHDLGEARFESFRHSWHGPKPHDFCQDCRIRLDQKVRAHSLYSEALVHWARFRMKGVLGGAKSRNFSVAIDDLDLLALFMDQGGVCALTGIKFSLRKRVRKSPSEDGGFEYFQFRRTEAGTVIPQDGFYRKKNLMAPSVDRIDSRKPYTATNVHLVLHVVNMMKSDMPLDDFVTLCKAVGQSQRARESEITRAIGWV